MRVCVLMPWGRVGSNLMMSYLQKCLDGDFASEPFNQIVTADEQADWLEVFFKSEYKGPDRCVKLSVRSLARLNPVQAFMNVNDVRVIRMFRRNHLKTVISQMRAVAYARQTETLTGTAQWGVLKGDQPLPPINIDIGTLAERIETIRDDQEDLQSMYFRDHLDVYYEDLNRDLSEELRRVSKFLGVDFIPEFDPPFAKATPDNLRDAIKNYDEIEHWIKSSPFDLAFLDAGS